MTICVRSELTIDMLGGVTNPMMRRQVILEIGVIRRRDNNMTSRIDEACQLPQKIYGIDQVLNDLIRKKEVKFLCQKGAFIAMIPALAA